MSSSKQKLPEGWGLPQIRNVFDICYGKGLPKKKRIEGKFPVYGSNGIVGYHNSAITDVNTIIIGRKGSVGKIHLSKSRCWPIDTTYYIDRFGGIDPRFTTFALKNLKLQSLESSSAIPGINRDRIYELKFPLAPLAEQQRIVGVIEKLFVRISDTKERLDNAAETMKRFRKSVLNAACTGKLTEDWREQNLDVESIELWLTRKKESLKKALKNKLKKIPDIQVNHIKGILPDSWIKAQIGDFCNVVRGAAPRPARDPRYFGGRIPWITVRELTKDNNMYITETDSFVTKLGKQKSRFIKEGTFLLSNSGATLGVPKITLISGCINDGSVAFFELDERIKKFLYCFLTTLTPVLRSLKQGSAQPNLNTGIVAAIKVPLPPLQEQKEIVRRVENLFELASKIESRISQARDRVEKLAQSILAKAFCGGLLPTEAELAQRQNRSYETAQELLNRVTKTKAIETKWKEKRLMQQQFSKRDREPPVRYSLLDILRKNPKGLTPELLLRIAHYTIEEIDDFYCDLSNIMQEIEEIKPSGSQAKKWPTKSKVLIKPKKV